jgi:uncharacterized protein YutE (UPF0331/DUF86 family)
VTDRDLVLRKLTVLLEHVARVRRRRPDELPVFEADVDVQDATAMSLLVAIQEAIDVALHVASDSGWGVPASYAESFELLAQHGVVEPDLVRRLVRMAAVRNRIAHGYASIDLPRLWSEAPAGLEALESFAAAVAGWLGKAP